MTLYLPKYCIVPLAAREDKTLNDSAKIYLGEINVLTNKFGYCCATDEQLSEMKDCSVRTIKNWHTELEKRGFIRRDTWREHYKNPNGCGVLVRSKRKLYVIEDPSNNVSEGQKAAPHSEGQKAAPHSEGQKTALINKQSEELNIKNNNNVVEEASPVVVVFSSLNKLNISKELKISLSKHHDEQKVNLLVKRVLKWKDRTGDAIACNTILNSWDTWCDKDTLKDREEQNKAESNELLNKLKKRRERAVNVSCEYPELNLVVTEHNICIQSAKGYVTVGFNDKIFDGYLSKIERQAKNQ